MSYESIAELADGDTTKIIQSCHPKCQKSVEAIYKYDLAPYMRWYPWRWFSDLVLIGSGGFSAVYAAHVALLYDASQDGQVIGQHKRPVAIKVVDEKILNEVIFKRWRGGSGCNIIVHRSLYNQEHSSLYYSMASLYARARATF